MAKQENFLPPGLALKKVERPPRWTNTIAQARIDAPVFRVKLAYMPYRVFRDAVVEAAQLRQRSGGSDPAETEMTAMRPMLQKVALDWEGATLANINAILRGDRVIRPSDDSPEAMAQFVETYVTKQEPFPFSIGLFTYIWFNSYPDKFQNPVFSLLQEWGDSIAAEVDKGKDD